MKRTELLAGIMQDIGLPLLLSMIDVDPNKSQDENVIDISKLLGSTLLTSETITRSLQVGEDEEDLDYLFRSTGFAAQIMAGLHRATKKMPSEKDIKRTVSSTTTLLAFSEHYKPGDTPEIEGSEMSDLLKKKLETNIDLRFLTVFIPVANVISEFSFGQTENKMIQDVSEKLKDHAVEHRKRILGNTLSLKEEKEAELIILESLANIYVGCHKAELLRVTSLKDSAKAAEKSDAQIQNIWDAFEQRMMILSNFTGYVLEESDESFVPDDIIMDSSNKNLDKDIDIYDILNSSDTMDDMDIDSIRDDIPQDEDEEDGEDKDGTSSSGPKATKPGTPMSFYSADDEKENKKKKKIPAKKKKSGPMSFYENGEKA